MYTLKRLPTSKTNLIYYSTSKIKAMADVRPIAIDDADSIIRSFHLTLRANGEIPAVNGGKVPNGESAVNGNGVTA